MSGKDELSQNQMALGKFGTFLGYSEGCDAQVAHFIPPYIFKRQLALQV